MRGTQEEGGLITMEDLDRWQVYIEEPVSTGYKGIDVYKLTSWVQGPVMLQALNMLEDVDLKGMGFNSAEYLHTLYQVMNLSFADRDFYYGDPYFPPEEPMAGLLSKEYAKSRFDEINWTMNDPDIRPGDPYPFMDAVNPFREYLDAWTTIGGEGELDHMAPGDVTPGRRGGGGNGSTARICTKRTFIREPPPFRLPMKRVGSFPSHPAEGGFRQSSLAEPGLA